MKLLIIVAVSLAVIDAGVLDVGVTYTRCELVWHLRAQGFPEQHLRHWICLIEYGSGGNTRKIKSKPGGSRSYGLFQIADKWCSESDSPGKECFVTCHQLLTVDITNAASCAKKIYHRLGFNAWQGWKKRCTPEALSHFDIDC